MHDDQIDVTLAQAAALVAEQIPELAGATVTPVNGSGTSHAIFRVGDRLAARFPIRADDPDRTEARLHAEAAAALEFIEATATPSPRPLGVWQPGHGFPLPWATQTWVPGDVADPTTHRHSLTLADDLASRVQRMRAAPVHGRRFTGAGRGGHLPDHDGWVAICISNSDGLLDTAAMRTLWSQFRDLPREDDDVMSHTDLIPPNIVVADGRLTGVLDAGGFAAADPALDLVAAWHFFDEGPREHMRTALRCPELQWLRGAAWAFQQAIGLCWYYRLTNPTLATMGHTTLARIAATFR